MIWPAEIAVPPRKVRGLHEPAPGEEEGELCLRNAPGYPTCLGKLELRRSSEGEERGCTCFLSAPCGSCMSEVPECRLCGWRAEEPN